jgi:hypothetical protein
MAQRIVTILDDDLDGSPATTTIEFALGGIQYIIDLNDEHAHELRDSLAKYIAAGRKSGRAPRTSRPADTPAGGPSPKVVRAWAKEQGLQVSDRGRIQADIMAQYVAAH